MQNFENPQNTKNESRSEKDKGELGNESYDRIQSRKDAIAWLTLAMGKSLEMGGHSPDEVGMAGRKWLDS